MIGGWDNSNCFLDLSPCSWSNGNGTSDKNTGNHPSFPGGAYQPCAFTNMGTGYGYKYISPGNGHINYDGSNDLVQLNYNHQTTDAGLASFETWFRYGGLSSYLFGAYDDGNNFFGVSFTGAHKIRWQYDKAGSWRYALGSPVLTSGTIYHLVVRKNGSALDILLDGSEVSYDTKLTYNLGNFSLTQDVGLGAMPTFGGYFNKHIFLFSGYSVSLIDSRVSTNYGLGKDRGLIGNNVGDTMSLSAPGGVAPKWDNQYRRRVAA